MTTTYVLPLVHLQENEPHYVANQFKELNSKLNREVAQYEASVRQGTHTFGSGGTYEPGSADAEMEAEATVHVLGGSSTASSVDLSREERRQRVLDATLNRLKAEEAEIEDKCGTTKHEASG